MNWRAQGNWAEVPASKEFGHCVKNDTMMNGGVARARPARRILGMPPLLTINPALERAALAERFAENGRLQIRDVLTGESARLLQDLLQRNTPWCLAWQAGSDGPHLIRPRTPERDPVLEEKLAAALRGDAYAFRYSSYPLVTAYLERWYPGAPHERLLEELNGADWLGLVRELTGIGEIVKLDGQATLYEPGDFLSLHDDREDARGRRVAYVLNLAAEEWRPEWGGYLNFFDDGLDIEQAIRPRFNTLNLFRVPRLHNVSRVADEAPLGRYAITGWARDR